MISSFFQRHVLKELGYHACEALQGQSHSPRVYVPSLLHTHGSYFFFSVVAFSSFTATVVAVMRYSMVTLAPTFSSPVTFVFASRPISHFSLPFCTTIESSVTASTGPVTWYVFPAPKAGVAAIIPTKANRIINFFIVPSFSSFPATLQIPILFSFCHSRSPEDDSSHAGLAWLASEWAKAEPFEP